MTAASRASRRMEILSVQAALPTPTVVVVPNIGRRVLGTSGLIGDRGAAVTILSPRHRVVVRVDQDVDRDLTDAGLDYLLAHELGHIALHRGRPAQLLVALRVCWLLLAAGFVLSLWPDESSFDLRLAACGVIAVGIMIILADPYLQRRWEEQADVFAVRLLRTTEGADETMRYLDKHLPAPAGPRRMIMRLLGTHPPRPRRLQLMREAIQGGP